MIKTATKEDCKILATLAINMWQSHTMEDLTQTFEDTVQSRNAVCFLKYFNSIPVGFAQCSLRCNYVEGTKTSPVGYLEGIFVEKDFRNKGFATELLRACESWAKNMGSAEFASDCELNNTDSLRFHLASGFQEANRIICFKKDI